jgi:hypothetical protein
VTPAPSIDALSHAAAVLAQNGSAATLHPPNGSAVALNGSAVAFNGSAVTLNGAAKPLNGSVPHLVVPGADDPPEPGSDVSQGTDSTVDGRPVRRKSVRVSLQPTFSPTPPALEDDEDADAEREYWTTRGRRATVGNRGGRGGSDEEREDERWKDSSDEDEDYARARQLLKKLKKGW